MNSSAPFGVFPSKKCSITGVFVFLSCLPSLLPSPSQLSSLLASLPLLNCFCLTAPLTSSPLSAFLPFFFPFPGPLSLFFLD